MEPLFDDETQEIMNKVTLQWFRDYIASTLGPSPFDFRGRHLMSKEQAEGMADEAVKALEGNPKRMYEVIRSLFEVGGV